MPANFVPTEKKRALGNPGHRTLPDPQILIPRDSDIPTTPDHLGEHGTELWQRVWSSCSAWVSSITDIALVIRYCEAADEREEMKAIVAQDGLLVDGAGNTTKPHPLIKCIRDLDALLVKYEGLLGLTPADRSKLGVSEIRKIDALDTYLEKQKKRERKRA